MADSPDTTTPSFVTRRAVQLTTPARLPVSPAPSSQCDTDAVMTLWGRWCSLHSEVETKHREWQKLEEYLFRTVGFPHVAVPTPNNDSLVHVISHPDIDK